MQPWSREEFIGRLEAVGRDAYHDRHPFHHLMNEGRLDPLQIRTWVANRFYYQKVIPRKDAALIARCPRRDVRRRWVQRILDHDGTPDQPGGIEQWLVLGEAVGLSREALEQDRLLLPAVRYAVDAYLRFVETHDWVEGVASSLTELFAPPLLGTRLAALERHYPWIDPAGLAYFRQRLTRAPRDAEHGLAIVLEECGTRERQERALAALRFKCELLWAQLDALHHHLIGRVTAAATIPAISPATTGAAAPHPAIAARALQRPVLATHARLRWDTVRAEHQLVFPEGVLALNDTAAAVVRGCDGRVRDDLIASLGRTFEDLRAEDVDMVLARLARRGLVRDAAG